MHVLVTGGAGFIGSHMVDALVARGDHVRILDALVPRVHDGAPAVTPTSGVELMVGTVIDRAVLSRALAGIDVVFHLAAYQDYLTDFSTFFLTNSVGTALLYELIVTEHLPVRKVVVASSQAVYGEGKHRCAVDGVQYPNQRSPEQLAARDWEVHCPVCNRPTEPDWTDEAVVRPHNSYAMSKRDQEDIAISLGRLYAIPSVALRYSIVQGPRQSFRNAYSGALRSFSVRVLTGQPPVIYEDGQQLRDYVSVHDVVRANLLALGDERANYQVYNVGGNRRVTVNELAQQVIQAAGVSIEPVTSGEYRLGDTRHVFSDTAKLQALGWQPRVSLPAIVAEYLAWAAAQPDLHDSFALAHAQMLAMGVVRETRSWAPISLRSPGLSPP